MKRYFESYEPKQYSRARAYRKGGVHYKRLGITEPHILCSILCKNCHQPYGDHYADGTDNCPTEENVTDND